jgi:hypothetical protein
MRKIFIECGAINCLHHDRNSPWNCNAIGADTFISVSRDGRCLDYAAVTDNEYEEITGFTRKGNNNV